MLKKRLSFFGQQEQGTQRTKNCRVSFAIILLACRTSQYSPGVGVMTILETSWRLVTASSMLPGLKPTSEDILRIIISTKILSPRYLVDNYFYLLAAGGIIQAPIIHVCRAMQCGECRLVPTWPVMISHADDSNSVTTSNPTQLSQHPSPVSASHVTIFWLNVLLCSL